MKHTPGPWSISAIRGFDKKVVMAGNITIADCRCVDQAEANAEYIVKAVNSHEELLGQLKNAVARSSFQGISEARKAIANAEGGSKWKAIQSTIDIGKK